MTHQEFTERVNLNVGAYYFDKVIHPDYMRSNLDKDAWCKLWKKNGGYQRALDWEIMQKNALLMTNEKNEKNIQILRTERAELINENTALLERNKELCQKVIELKEASVKMTAEIEQLIEISETYSSAELRQLVIDKIGFKAYIAYKIEHDKNIWAMDKEELIKTLTA